MLSSGLNARSCVSPREFPRPRTISWLNLTYKYIMFGDYSHVAPQQFRIDAKLTAVTIASTNTTRLVISAESARS